MPLRPEAMVRHDGTAHNDGERNAAKRLVAMLRPDHPQLKCILTEDSLSSNAPPLETRHASGRHYLLGVNAGEQASVVPDVAAAAQTGCVTAYERPDRAAGLVPRLRLLKDVPLQASPAAGRGNCVEYWEIGQDNVQHCSGVTDLRVNQRPVLHLRRGGRARGKIAQATCHPLQTQGYHFAHHDGHGEPQRSVVWAMLLMLAFWVDQAQQLCCALCQAVWANLGSTRLLWERMQALFYDYACASLRQRFEALLSGGQQSSPLVTLQSAYSSPWLLRRCAIAPGRLSSPATARPQDERGPLST